MVDEQTEAMRPEGERRILAMVRWLLYLAFLVIGYFILTRLAPVLTPLIAAAGVAYLLDGAVDRLEARGVNRTVAVALLLVLFLGVLTAIVVFVLPLASQELISFFGALPEMIERASLFLQERFGVEIPDRWGEYVQSAEVEAMLKDAAGPIAGYTAAAIGGLFSFLGTLAELLIIPVFAFYFMVDWNQIVRRAESFVPPRHRESVGSVAREIDQAVSTWIRGQLMVISILAVLYAVAFEIIGIQLGLTIGVIVGLLTIIPFLGTFAGAGLTAVMILLDWRGPEVLIATAAVFVVLHLLEAALLTPKLVGKKVGLGEVGALFAVIAGGELLGFAGVLLAVPLAASVAVLVRRALHRYERSSFFNEGAEDAVPSGRPWPEEPEPDPEEPPESEEPEDV